MQVQYHRLGTKQAEDLLVFDRQAAKLDPRWTHQVEVTHDGRFVLVSVKAVSDGDNMLYYFDLDKLPDRKVSPATTGSKALPFVGAIDRFEAKYKYIHNEGTVFTLFTNLAAPRFKIVRINLAQPGTKNKWETIVPEDPKDVLEWAVVVDRDKLLLCYLSDVKVYTYLYLRIFLRAFN